LDGESRRHQGNVIAEQYSHGYGVTLTEGYADEFSLHEYRVVRSIRQSAPRKLQSHILKFS